MCQVKLSIIIPHYNSVVLLQKLLLTIPNSNEIQIIVIDDRSDIEYTRYTQLQNNLKERNIEFYTNNTGTKGAGVARNIGLEHARGDWVLFADADDYFQEEFYEIVHSYFHSAHDIIFFTPISYLQGSLKLSDRHIPYEQLVENYRKQVTLETEIKLRYNFVSPCSKLIRRSLFAEHNIKFDEVMYSNDVMCAVYLGHYARTVDVSNKVIYCITKGKQTLTTNITENNINTRLDVWIRKQQFLKANLKMEVYELFDYNMVWKINDYKGMNRSFKWYVALILRLHKCGIPIVEKTYRNPFLFLRKLGVRLKRKYDKF